MEESFFGVPVTSIVGVSLAREPFTLIEVDKVEEVNVSGDGYLLFKRVNGPWVSIAERSVESVHFMP